ncbi:MAG: tetratricopeptide repeat protein [bacterium]|nr:tetratricopeptide repeat protein [bacterium]
MKKIIFFIAVSISIFSYASSIPANPIELAYKNRDWDTVKRLAQEELQKSKSSDAYRYLGIAQAATGDTTAAIQSLKNAIQLSKKDGKAILTLTQIYINIGNLIEAKQLVNDGMKNVKNNLDVMAAKALVLAHIDSISEASNLIWAVTSKEKQNATYYKIQGLISRKEGVVDFVIESFKKALELDPKDNDIRFELGLAYQHNKKINEALETFLEVYKAEPNFPGVNYRIGQLLYYNARGDTNKIKEALDYLIRASKEKPNAEVHRSLGEAYARLGKFEQAENELKTSLKLREDPSVRKLLADIYMLNRKFDLATDLWKPLIQSADFDSARFFKLVEVSQAFLERDSTKHNILLTQVDLLKTLASNNKTNENLYTKIGLLYYGIGYYDSAVVWFKKRLEIDPQHSATLINYGYALYNLQKYDDALAALKQGLAKNDSSIAPYQIMIDILQKQKNESAAIELAENLRKRSDFDKQWYLLLANLYYNKKQFSKAIAVLEAADNKFPAQADIWVWIGINRYSLYANEPSKTGLLNSAKAAFRKALEFDPENRDAKNYLNQLGN